MWTSVDIDIPWLSLLRLQVSQRSSSHQDSPNRCAAGLRSCGNTYCETPAWSDHHNRILRETRVLVAVQRFRLPPSKPPRTPWPVTRHRSRTRQQICVISRPRTGSGGRGSTYCLRSSEAFRVSKGSRPVFGILATPQQSPFADQVLAHCKY